MAGGVVAGPGAFNTGAQEASNNASASRGHRNPRPVIGLFKRMPFAQWAVGLPVVFRYHSVKSRSTTGKQMESAMAASDEEQAVTVEERRVYCDGGGGALGHPGVYLNIEGAGGVACPYCSRRFQLAEGAAPAAGH